MSAIRMGTDYTDWTYLVSLMGNGFQGDTSLRRMRHLRGYGAFVVALVFGLAWWMAPVSAVGYGMIAVILLLICGYGVFQLWLAARTPADAVAAGYVDPNKLPLAERQRYFRRMLIFGVIVFPALSVWTAYQLNQIEAGGEGSLWFLVAFLYDSFGYWPAVLLMPAFGLLVLSVSLVKLTNPPEK